LAAPTSQAHTTMSDSEHTSSALKNPGSRK
jgi:hypothetical protein